MQSVKHKILNISTRKHTMANVEVSLDPPATYSNYLEGGTVKTVPYRIIEKI